MLPIPAVMAVKIGLEVHGYLNVESGVKLFCDCSLGEAEPNSNICPVCTAMPGSKPMLPNREAVEKVIAISGMLDCRINSRLLFQRKHYSWPDLPSGYQRTMSGSYSVPVGEAGSFLGIGIADVHLEEDPARWEPGTGCVDYNRSGFPLVEIVTSPDFASSGDVRVWLRRLVTALSYIRAINSGAGIKSDVNVSVAPDFRRVEVKNVNSFRSIIRAIEFEVRRQEALVRDGKIVEQETRAWDDAAGVTVFMRKKEKAMDYMFIPEPDLPVVSLDAGSIKSVVGALPERPAAKAEKYAKMGVDSVDAEVLSSEILLAEMFEAVSKEVSPVLAARWFRRELLRVLNYSDKGLDELELDEKHIIQLLRLVESGSITDEVAKGILERLVEKPFDVDGYVRKNDLFAVGEADILEKYCREAVAENPAAVADYKAGNVRALNFIVGSVMKKSKGKATPQEVRRIIEGLLR